MTDIEVEFHPKGGFPLFLEDLERDTIGWSNDERYYYIRLLDHMYRAGGFLPDDVSYICEVIGLRKGRGYKQTVAKLRRKLVTKAEANGIANGIANAFAKAFITRLVFETKGDWLTQKRVLKEVAKSYQNHKKASAGGQAKAEKSSASGTPVDVLDGVLPSPPSNVSKDTPAKAASSPPSGDDPPSLAKMLFDQGVALLVASGVSEKSARPVIGKLQKAVGDGDAMKIIDDARTRTDPKSWIMGAISHRNRQAGRDARPPAPMVGSEEALRRRQEIYGGGTS